MAASVNGDTDFAEELSRIRQKALHIETVVGTRQDRAYKVNKRGAVPSVIKAACLFRGRNERVQFWKYPRRRVFDKREF